MKKYKSLKFIILFLLMFFPIKTLAYQSAIDITEKDIFEIQENIKNNIITYEQLVNIYLERIEKYNSTYNAVITINENAIKEAKECDKYYKKTKEIPNYLFCIPILVKDNIDVKGMPTTGGSKSLSNSYPNEDSDIIKNLKEKNMIILGKTNMSEFAFNADSSKSSYGEVRNAYNKDYSSYGSSGGSAVSVALSFAPLAIGTDTNSSVRAPSAANNVTGLRPTLSILSTKGILAYDITRDTPGPITKTAKENALLLAAMEGKDENYYLKDIKDDDLKNKTIAILSQFTYGDNNLSINRTTDNILKKVDELTNLLEQNGANVIYIDDFYTSSFTSINLNTQGAWTMCYAYENNYIKNTSSKLDTFQKLTTSPGHIYSLYYNLERCNRDINIIKKYDSIKEPYLNALEKLFKDKNIDAVIYPTIKSELSKITNEYISSSSHLLAPTLGLPAITTSIGEINGLYYGIEIVSLRNNDNVVLNLAHNIEQLENAYKLPTDTPNLYEIPDTVNKLINLYTNKKEYKQTIFNKEEIYKYNDVLDKINNFFINYNEEKNIEQTSKKLINEYNTITEKLNNKQKKENKQINIYIIIIVLIIINIILYIKIIIKVKKIVKRKKKKEKKH